MFLAGALALALGISTLSGSANAEEASTPVTGTVETPSHFDDEAGGYANADDPAVWVDPRRAGQSLVVATLKEGGLEVYDLQGRLVQSIPAPDTAPGDKPGRFNNVDIVQDARIGERELDIAVVSDRGTDVIRTYAIDGRSRQPLTEITAPDAPWAFSTSQAEVNEEATAYGLTAFEDPANDGVLVAVSRADTTSIGLFRLIDEGGKVSYERVSTIDLPETFELPDGSTWTSCGDPGELPQVEGMVFDPEREVLYAAQEAIGLWEIPLGDTEDAELFEKVREYGVPWSYDAEAEEECTVHYDQDPGFGGDVIAADAEGLTLYGAGDDEGYLIASGQGDNSFAIFERDSDHDHLGSFTAAVDGDLVEHSDGSTVVNAPLGPDFPFGAFIAHDGHDTPDEYADGELRERTNFKFVPWENIADRLDLEIETGC